MSKRDDELSERLANAWMVPTKSRIEIAGKVIPLKRGETILDVPAPKPIPAEHREGCTAPSGGLSVPGCPVCDPGDST